VKNEPRNASMLHTSISPTIINGGYRSNVSRPRRRPHSTCA
jgi:hypothetical protein